MTFLRLAPIGAPAPGAGTKPLKVPQASQGFEREALGAAAGKFLNDGLSVEISIPDGDAVAAEIEALARRIEAFYRANPNGRWRFSAADPDDDPDDDLAALLEPTELAPAPAFTIEVLSAGREFWPNFGIPQDEFDRIALRHNRAVASEASSQATGYRNLLLSPKPSAGNGWTRMRLRTGASTTDVEAFEKAVASELLRGRSVDAYLPTRLPREEIKDACYEIERATRTMKKKRRKPRIEAAALELSLE